MDKKWFVYIGLVVLGVAAADRIRGLPFGSKIPRI